MVELETEFGVRLRHVAIPLFGERSASLVRLAGEAALGLNTRVLPSTSCGLDVANLDRELQRSSVE
jgi:hypothetical protein